MIRKAKHSDILKIVSSVEKFYPHTHYAQGSDFDIDTVTELTENMVRTGIVLVYEVDKKIVGVIGLVVIPFMFNREDSKAYEVIWWVEPEHQNSGAGVQLVLGAIEQASGLGCNEMQMTHMEDSPPQAKKVLERLGFVHTESSYSKRL